MSVVHVQLRKYLRRLLTIQMTLVTLAAAIAYFRYGIADSSALVYGGAIAIAGTLVLMWYGWRAESAGSSLARNAGLVYGSAVVRFFATLALFAAGLAVLHLRPLPLFIGFILGLIGQLVSTALVPGYKQWRAKR